MRQLSDPAGLPPAVDGAAGIPVRAPGLHDRRNDVCAAPSMVGDSLDIDAAGATVVGVDNPTD
jgi:hypothetical protein